MLIVKGVVEPGERLPSERELSKRFKVSRIPLREAIKRLEQMGLLEVKPGEGIFIGKPSSDILIEPLISNLILSKKDHLNLGEVRKIIEINSIKLAIQRASNEELEELQRIVNRSKKHVKDNEKFAVEDLLFHINIIKATHNPILIKLLYTIRNLMAEEIKINQAKNGVKEKSLYFHKEIFKYIKEKNCKKAIEAMRSHFEYMDSISFNNSNIKNSLVK